MKPNQRLGFEPDALSVVQKFTGAPLPRRRADGRG